MRAAAGKLALQIILQELDNVEGLEPLGIVCTGRGENHNRAKRSPAPERFFTKMESSDMAPLQCLHNHGTAR
jgi:hypothetical protein